MRIYHIIWLPEIEDKLYRKHNVLVEEVEEVLFDKPHIRFVEKGHCEGEVWSARSDSYMPEDKVSSISHSRTLEEMADFWDTHSLADYDDQTYEVEMTFDPSARRAVVTIEPELMADISRVARERKVSTQTLINVWLRQYVDKLMSQAAEAH